MMSLKPWELTEGFQHLFWRPIKVLSSKKFHEFCVETTTETDYQHGLKSLSATITRTWKIKLFPITVSETTRTSCPSNKEATESLFDLQTHSKLIATIHPCPPFCSSLTQEADRTLTSPSKLISANQSFKIQSHPCRILNYRLVLPRYPLLYTPLNSKHNYGYRSIINFHIIKKTFTLQTINLSTFLPLQLSASNVPYVGKRATVSSSV